MESCEGLQQVQLLVPFCRLARQLGEQFMGEEGGKQVQAEFRLVSAVLGSLHASQLRWRPEKGNI